VNLTFIFSPQADTKGVEEQQTGQGSDVGAAKGHSRPKEEDCWKAAENPTREGLDYASLHHLAQRSRYGPDTTRFRAAKRTNLQKGKNFFAQQG